MVHAKRRRHEQQAEIRCAIYARTSTEEGLSQEFNSLDAQTEACRAYITSQAGEGWVAHKQVFVDGGFSGGSMERPALQRLLAALVAHEIDVIVVYKSIVSPARLPTSPRSSSGLMRLAHHSCR